MKELKVAFHNFMNVPKNIFAGIYILCHVFHSCRINHLTANSGNDWNSYSKKHEIEEELSTRQKGPCRIYLQKFVNRKNHSKLIIVDVPI